MSRRRTAPQDGALPVARSRLADAVMALTHERRHTIRLDGGKMRRVRLLSRYDELDESIIAARDGHNGFASHSQVPFWVDAHDLLTEIDTEVVKMYPAPHGWPGWTKPRLQALDERRWRPQDCEVIFRYARVLDALTKRIDTLFAPRPIRLPDPCPECGVAHVYHDSDGEQVRNSALQITDIGATCGNCRAHWPIERLPLLGKVLGYGRTA